MEDKALMTKNQKTRSGRSNNKIYETPRKSLGREEIDNLIKEPQEKATKSTNEKVKKQGNRRSKRQLRCDTDDPRMNLMQ